MDQEIDFSEMPHDYVVCWHGNCPMAENCLRHMAARQLPQNRHIVKSVNLCAVNPESGTCPMQRPVQWVKNAYGMHNIYRDVRFGDKEMLYHTIWSALGNTMYYRYRNGKRPITPEIQATIASAFQSFGYTEPVPYDRIVEAVAW